MYRGRFLQVNEHSLFRKVKVGSCNLLQRFVYLALVLVDGNPQFISTLAKRTSNIDRVFKLRLQLECQYSEVVRNIEY